MSTVTELFILGCLLLANGLFAVAGLALVSARKTRLKKLADGGDERARVALGLAESPTRFLQCVRFWVMLNGLLAGAFSGATLAPKVAAWLGRFPVLAACAGALAFGGVVLVLAFGSLVAGELLPKRLALAAPERMALAFAVPLRRLAWLAAPFVRVLSAVTDGVLRLLGVKVRNETSISDEEVNTLVEQGFESGVFQKAEKEMVEGVLQLDQLPVTRLMTPRPKIVFLNLDDPEEVNWRKIVASGHSHFPVYQENRDQVLGMVAVKALWAHSAIGVQTSLKNLLTPPLIVSGTLNAIQLLETFKKSGKHAALVANEFGGIQGLVTLIDVMEAIVGDLPERGGREPPAARQHDDGSWLIDATMAVGDVKNLLRLDALPGESDAGYQTLGGFAFTQFGKIPMAGEHFDWHGWRFEVVDMDRRRVDKVLVGKIPAPATERQTL